ncbi:RNA polymerase II transcription factor SIII subunit A-domain-containing protein [Gymnopilus junonius]|uniref:RNA polymerase II transcription factor SIII subunit A-domain-containing protein n=1 Tax=Gymnopilus junonius TaxID=109634 RepID=A0A9P5NXL4_GYMJU|nr:RNA polymerase II transcription factor SIII subunit A-domain-containing protein [Gymnopilus junonius]
MDTENDFNHRRVPTLVQLCQRAAVAQVDSIHSLGDDLTYCLVKPVLERCTPEQLIRFEQLSPHLRKDTPEIWKDLCFRKYRLMALERYSLEDDPLEPDSWKSRLFALQDAEARRIEEVGSKLRIQRMEADERKKEKEIKFTDRVPMVKRPRAGWGNTQPKTLFQKIKSDASKVQRAYTTRVLPPMPTSKNFRILPTPHCEILPPVSASSIANRVTVNTVIHRRPSSSTSSSSTSSSFASYSALPSKTFPLSVSPSADTPNKPDALTRSTNCLTLSHSVAEPQRVIPRVPSTPRKDPMASLFVPKRKVPPQRPI